MHYLDLRPYAMKKHSKKSIARPAESGRSKYVVVLAAVLAALTLAVYWQAAGFELTNYDDDVYVSENPNVLSGLSPRNLAWAFTTFHSANWHPLTWVSLMLDSQRAHGTPGAYHATNVFLHLLSVLLLYLMLHTATHSIWRSAFVAALFAVHPLHAESVAWVAERKDVLSTVFWMLTLLVYVRCARAATPALRALLVTVFALGLLAKPMLVSLPLVLLMLDYWPLRRTQGTGDRKQGTESAEAGPSLILEKLPLFALAAASCVVTFWAQRAGEAVRALEAYPVGVRLANAAVVCVSYLGNAVWPVKLVPYYPHPGASLPAWQVASCAVLIVAVTFAAVRYRRRAPYLFVGWLWYLVTLVPVIGIVQVGDQAMADRYTYVPLIGIFIAVVWAVGELARAGDRDQGRVQARSRALAAIGGVVVLALTFAGYRQVGYWRDSRTLFAYTAGVSPGNHLAHNNLGAALLDDATSEGEAIDRRLMAEAIRELRESLRIKPGYVEALYNLGTALGRSGQTDEALEILERALGMRPDAPKAHNNAGVILLTRRDFARAEVHFRAAVKSKPDLSQAQNNLSYALFRQGKYVEAVEPARRALEINPDFYQARINLGNAMLCLKRYPEAVRHYEIAVEQDPARISLRLNFSTAYEMLGRKDDAIKQLRAALEREPDNAMVRTRLARLAPAGVPDL
jgi:tetratricopeptide (TPR) repeat protein